MKQADVAVGGRYLARVSGQLVEVEVVRADYGARGKRVAYRVRRVDTGAVLPKPRTAAALRPLGPAMPSFDGVAMMPVRGLRRDLRHPPEG